MGQFFDKKFTLNYLITILFLGAAVLFLHNVLFAVWHINIFNFNHIEKLFKIIVSGKIFSSMKYLSFFISLIGFCILTLGAISLSMSVNYIKQDIKDVDNPSETDVVNKVDVDEKLKISDNQKVSALEDKKLKFSMYDNPKESVNNNELSESSKIKLENNMNENLPDISELSKNNKLELNENEEREKLQNKIQELMKQIDSSKNDIEDVKEENNFKNQDNKSEKLLSHVDFVKYSNPVDKVDPTLINAEKVLDEMNYKNISEDQNILMEQCIIGSGCKLLSEIRIGDTGIDYVAVSKDEISVIQLDNSSGNWMANEEVIVGNDKPLWYSEEGNKISPIYRAISARNDIVSLLNNAVNIPVKAYACLVDSNISNMDELETILKKENVELLRLVIPGTDEILLDDIVKINDLFAPNSRQEPDAKTMNSIIDILEKAEIPE